MNPIQQDDVQLQGSQGSGGLSITGGILDILDQPGYISYAKGRDTIQKWYSGEMYSKHMSGALLPTFGALCFYGHLELAQQMIVAGTAPDLNGSETPLRLGYVNLVVIGARGVKRGIRDFRRGVGRHIELITFLISKGAPVEVEDVVGHTALHHAIACPYPHLDIARLLLQSGANVNHRNRFGGVLLLVELEKNLPGPVDLLMEFGADLDIPDAENMSPRAMLTSCGPQIVAIERKWLRKRAGEDSPAWSEKKCDNCGRNDLKLSRCATCRTVRYCTRSCQRTHWQEHKQRCLPFSTNTTVTLKPRHNLEPFTLLSPAEVVHDYGGNIRHPEIARRIDAARLKASKPHAGPRNMIIKMHTLRALLRGPGVEGEGLKNEDLVQRMGLIVYTKKRDFDCRIDRADDPLAYDKLLEVIRANGLDGDTAYFAAELVNPDELVVKISDVLAEQPF